MRVALLTREWPPEVYGGAGVHVEYLAKELAKLTPVDVHCFGEPRPEDPRPGAPALEAYRPWEKLAGDARHASVLGVMSVNLAMASNLERANIAHSHTWYANFGGHLAKMLYGIPHVATTHSLEPSRPWKVEQLGAGGYALSTFCERIALTHADTVIAVSEAMRLDVQRYYSEIDAARIEVIHNGIDPEEFKPDLATDVLEALGIDPDRPIVLFVGRITRQKGIAHLLEAVLDVDYRAQIVLRAGSPDTREIGLEVGEKIEQARAQRGGIVWIERMLTNRELIQLLSHTTVSCVPSIYEPLGIVNLEAMACESAVVASAVGGIPEVVVDGETGLLVPLELDASGNPSDPRTFAHDLAERIDALVADPVRAKELGRAGRQRVLERFSWSTIARRTLTLYERLLGLHDTR